MKTAVLHLQPYDDVPTLQDKMLWARAPRILLVWPAGRRTRLRGPLDLVQLRRYAARLGARLAIVSREPQVQAWARQARVPVFPDEATAQRRPWRVPRRKVRRPRRAVDPRRASPPRATLPARPRAVRALAVLAALAALLALAGFLLPAARLTLVVPAQVQQATLRLVVGPYPDALPPETITVTVAGTYTRAVQGRRAWPSQAARGEVVLTNLGSEAVTLPAGLRIASERAPEVVFEIGQPVTVPGRGQVTVPVFALVPGRVGNRPPGDLRRLPPPWDVRVSATNPEPTTGGQDADVPWPTSAEYAALARHAQEDLHQQAATALAAQPGLWVPATLTLDTTLQRGFTPAQPAASPVLTLRLEQRYRAIGLSAERVTAWLHDALDAHLQPGWQALPETLSWEPRTAEPEPLGSGAWAWTVTARRWVYPAPDRAQVAARVRGRPREAAAQALRVAWDLPRAPEMQLWPAFWPWLPWWEARVQITLQPQAPEE